MNVHWAILAARAIPSEYWLCGASRGDRFHAFFELHGEFLVSRLSTGHNRHGVCQDQILHSQPIPASYGQQFHEADGRPLVAVHKAVIGDDGVDEGGRLLVDGWVVAVIGPCGR